MSEPATEDLQAEQAPQALPLPALWDPEPAPLGVDVEPSGHPAVDAALEHLAALDGAPTTEHAAVYEDVQQTLSTILTSLDDGDGDS
ncbi:hypothetical protein [Kitasatospora kifunensis]|uniref:Uncharacterized protein n=1 Tax=Kitasatospora kifunensis TaxID=58351 RepID=A0A7W7R615_KITKI|nr:hypothetical protein [Kitasatospora kifunensis]MBB4926077.1 hypothetical protein [Kitasatospora kifunensis]